MITMRGMTTGTARLWNAGKYLLRAGHKEYYVQDLEKAVWYIQREIDKAKENYYE